LDFWVGELEYGDGQVDEYDEDQDGWLWVLAHGSW
jgi:hypothetical protein